MGSIPEELFDLDQWFGKRCHLKKMFTDGGTHNRKWTKTNHKAHHEPSAQVS